MNGTVFIWMHKNWPEFIALEGKRGDRQTYVQERTCNFVSSRGSDCPPVCDECGYELGIYDCEWFENGTYGYGGNYCPNCGAKVVEQ